MSPTVMGSNCTISTRAADAGDEHAQSRHSGGCLRVAQGEERRSDRCACSSSEQSQAVRSEREPHERHDPHAVNLPAR